MVSFAQATPTASSRAERPGSFLGFTTREVCAPALRQGERRAAPSRDLSLQLWNSGVAKKNAAQPGVDGVTPRQIVFNWEAILSRQRPQKRWLALRAEGRSGPPQPIALRLPVKV